MSDIQIWTLVFVGLSFGTYLTIAWRSRVRETKGFYVAGQGIPAVANGAAVAADWMSAASFISMAGLIAFLGSDGSVYLMGWTGGYVLLALLLAPYLRKWGKFTVPEFVGDRYSEYVRLIAAVAAIIVSFTYVVGQMRGGGIVFSRFLNLTIEGGVAVAAGVIFLYAVLGGMKGITWTQVAQYTVMIVAYLIPAWTIAQKMTGFPVPQVTFGQILDELNALSQEFGLEQYTEAFAVRPQLDVFLVTLSLMIGTAGLPHVIIRFYTTKSVRGARFSALWALVFIGLLYTTAPAVGAFTKLNLMQSVNGVAVDALPAWVNNWAATGLVTVSDSASTITTLSNDPASGADLVVNNDILVLATPEIAGLPAPIVGLVAAGGLAAAMSTAAGLLLVISSSVSHDLYFRVVKKPTSDSRRLLVGRIAMGAAVLVAIYGGINPPAYVAQVVAFAFGLAASTFFPILVLGIFWKRANAVGAASGMISGLAFTGAYMIYTLEVFGTSSHEFLFGISPEGIGALGALVNVVVTVVVSQLTTPPTEHVQEMVEELRYPARRVTSPVAETE
ncbi:MULTISPECIES: sodium:solute symporter family protein [unclassified Isoptericola]|uniref:sodium:solute symporter family protein n=1 Tax=unclassified Isoptericola TaxID=2623355 RepID=UPI002713E2DD|nr:MULTISPECIES: sodium:solute symporter family protein [unclassified Isoptericola]MDO8144426.1 sodium:solute symporter family protein [Isoptericola sp. 178]MDO8151761.1 sodium:solute symporter family protein [Isoptericola sp. b408]